jgi:tRNA threonylcarbamoyladenosine biosynthesis protein TsaE
LQQRGHTKLVQVTRTAGETQALGGRLAACLQPGDVLYLRGELGAGKTTFIQGLARGLGVEGHVVSPSFTLVHEHRGRLPFYHLDLYRLGAEDLADIGIEEVLSAEAVVAVEWAERLPKEMRRDGLMIEITFPDDGGTETRRLRIVAVGPRGDEMIEQLGAETNADPGA